MYILICCINYFFLIQSHCTKQAIGASMTFTKITKNDIAKHTELIQNARGL